MTKFFDSLKLDKESFITTLLILSILNTLLMVMIGSANVPFYIQIACLLISVTNIFGVITYLTFYNYLEGIGKKTERERA